MDPISKFNELLEEEICKGSFPGANYVIVINNKKYFGSIGSKALIPDVEKNDIDTIYDMASLSKVISTTTCALKLLEEGKLRVEERVVTYLPQFIHQDISIWNLMTHTSGLPEGITGLFKMSSKDEVINKALTTDKKYEVGSKISYSDINYILLGLIIEKITNMPLNVFAKQVIFDPLQMKDTTYLPQDKNRCAPTELRDDTLYKGVVRGFVHDETALLLGGVAGHAGLFSTVKDMSNFIEMVLNDGMFNNKKILDKHTIDLMFKKQVQEKSGVMLSGTIRSLGWLLNCYAGPNGNLTSDETIHHTGFTGTSVWIDRVNKVGFCLLTNRVHPKRGNILHIDARARLSNFIMAHLDEF